MIILYLLLAALAVFFVIRAIIARRNYRHNCAHEEAARACIGEDGFWHGQGREGLASMRFGYYPVARSGCGAIAAANVLAFFGRSMPLTRVIAACEWGTLFLGAHVGLNPFALLPILTVLCRRAGLRVQLRGTMTPPESLPEGGVLVLTHLNGTQLRSLRRDGAHTVMLYAADDGSVRVANCFNRMAEAGRYASVAAYLRGRPMLLAIAVR